MLRRTEMAMIGAIATAWIRGDCVVFRKLGEPGKAEGTAGTGSSECEAALMRRCSGL